jgi:putative heme-binding domain-containing protein
METPHAGQLCSPPTGKAAACTACHFLHGTGRDFGPDLSKVGARLSPEQILESLLTPSKTLADGYQ